MKAPNHAQLARLVKACLDLQDAARNAGLRMNDVAVTLEPELFDLLRQSIKKFAGQSTDFDCGLLIRGFPIFRAGTSKDDCDAFLKQARARQIIMRASTVGHG